MLVLLRHGQSAWNLKNRFTGWIDIPLSKQGIDEAVRAGQRLKKISFDTIFISYLERSAQTAMIALAENEKIPYIVHPHDPKYALPLDLKEQMIPVFRAEELNERYYGDLQGLDKDETRAKYGKEQVHIWRRSFDVAPPQGESLKMCSQRTQPWFFKTVIPLMEQKKNVLIVAHGNSLRSIVMGIKNLTEEEVINLEMATGDPVCFSYREGKWSDDQL